MDAMDRFVSRENIKRYRHLASETTDAAERSKIMKLLADEEARFKLETSGRGDASERMITCQRGNQESSRCDGEE